MQKLTDVRLSFSELWEAKPYQAGDKPMFKASFLMKKGGALHKEIDKAIQELAEAEWGAKAKNIIASIRNNPNKFCFQDGDSKEWDGYAGMMALSAKSAKRPLIVDRDKTSLTEADGRPYDGCYVIASVELFTYSKGGNGISAQLRGVQFLRDGDAFSGGTPASEDEFDNIEEGADAGEIA